MADRTALVVSGGDPIAARPPAAADVVIAADSGLGHALALGLTVDVVVGDLDSVDADRLAEAEAGGTVVESHPADKDATDLELALAAARRHGATRVVVLGGAGGRLDHLLANALLLGHDAFAGLDVEWHAAGSRAVVVRDAVEIAGAAGDLVSLLPLGGPAHDVTTSGLRWPLDGETLLAGTTRGVSNEMTAEAATVAVGAGTLLAIHTPAADR